MKLRLRLAPKQTVSLEVPDKNEAWTLAELIALISSTFNLSNVKVSLNGKEPISDDLAFLPLSQIGICGGDLIYALSDSPPLNPTAPSSSSSSSSNRLVPSSTSSATPVSYFSSPTSSTSSSSSPSSLPSNTSSTPSFSSSSPSPSSSASFSSSKPTSSSSKPSASASHSQAMGVQFSEKLATVFTSASPRTPHEAVCAFIHLLMLENGFEMETATSQPQMPSDWKKPAFYLLSYSHPLSPPEKGKITLKCIPMQNMLLIHASLKDSGSALSFKADVTEYVRIDLPLDKGPVIFKKSEQLARTFKESISYPTTTLIYGLNGVSLLASLAGLMPELKLHVLSFLDAKSLVRMSQINKEFKRLTNDPFLWRRLACAKFGVPKGPISSQNWKELFKNRTEEEKRRKKMRAEYENPSYYPPTNLYGPTPGHYPPSSGSFPGVYGGDYDRMPGFAPAFPGVFPAPGFQPGFPGIGGMPPGFPPGARFDPFGPIPDNNPFGSSRGGSRGGRGGRGRGNDPFGSLGGGFGGGFM